MVVSVSVLLCCVVLWSVDNQGRETVLFLNGAGACLIEGAVCGVLCVVSRRFD